MNTFWKWGLPVVAGAMILSGCNQSRPEAEPMAQEQKAPEGSSHEEAHEETGAAPHHADEAAAVDPHTRNTKLEFSTPTALQAGKPADWTLKIVSAKDGQPMANFAKVHDKLMHLIVVSKDLSWFSHIHPKYEGAGVFKINATIPRGGDFKLYADYTPEGQSQEVAQHAFAVEGKNPLPAKASLTPDKMQGAWLLRQAYTRDEGREENRQGVTYQVALMPMPAKLVAGKEAMLHFQVRDAKGKPITDLQPYLGALGHCVILSEDSDTYLHSHPMEGGGEHDMSKMGEMKHSAPPKSGGPDVMFHTEFPKAGRYKAWGQFMHKGKIITAAFVLNVEAAKP